MWATEVTVVERFFIRASAMVADQAAENGSLLGKTALKGAGREAKLPGNCRETQGAQAKSLGDEIVDLTGETFRFPCSPARDRADAFPQLP